MYNPNKIIGLRTSIIRGFQSEDKPFSYIDQLVHNNSINSQDVNSYKVQLKLNEVIEKLNEMIKIENLNKKFVKWKLHPRIK